MCVFAVCSLSGYTGREQGTKCSSEREKKGTERECVRECVSSSKPHVRILLGKSGMLQDEKQMW